MKAFSILLLVTCGAFAQTFEVASVKPNHSGSGRVMISRPDGGRFTTENTSLKMLITFAYDIRDTQLTGGPTWMDSDRWDIVAKPDTDIPRTPEGQAMLRKMVQGLLADRFHLVFHKDSKELPVYSLSVAKTGPKLKNSDADTQPMMRMGMGTLEGKKISMPMLARALSTQLGMTVTDGTSLKGDYDVTLQFTPEAGGLGMKPGGPEHPEAAPADSDKPTLMTAVQEQLGLKLESRKERLDLFVIDSAEKASEN